MGTVADNTELNIGKGKVYFDRLASGVSTGLAFLGACTAFELVPSAPDVKEIFDPTQSSNPLLDSVASRQIHSVNITMSQINQFNLALATMGDAADITVSATPIVDEQIVRIQPLFVRGHLG